MGMCFRDTYRFMACNTPVSEIHGYYRPTILFFRVPFMSNSICCISSLENPSSSLLQLVRLSTLRNYISIPNNFFVFMLL